jgi:ankyrin repeat protein
MATPPRAEPARLLEFLPAIVLAGVGVLVPHPSALIALALSLPLALIAAARSLGLATEASFPRVALARGPGLMLLLLVHALLFAAVLGWPAALALKDRSPLAAVLLSAGFVAIVLSPWRWWPAFGLIAGVDGLHREGSAPARPGGIGVALRTAAEFGRRGDPHFSVGLAVSLALVVLVGGALAIAALAGVIDEDLRRAVGLGWALVALPLASRIVVARTLRLAATLGPGQAPAEPLALADDAVVEIPVDPRERDRELIARCAAHEIDLALVLLRNGADPNARPDPFDRDQRTPAIIAATEPDLRLLRELILRGADLNLAIGGLTPLIAATRDSWSGRIESVQTLLTNGARTDVADAAGDSPLHHAARTRDPIVAAMLLDAGADVARTNAEGLTPIGVACRAANEAVVRLLLERGAGGDLPGAVPALVALAEADEDLPDLAKRLIRAKYAVDAGDRDGRAALHAAATSGHAAIAHALLAAGAEVDARAGDGSTPLVLAARAGANAVLAVLARAKADPTVADATGTDALMAAAESTAADEATIEALLKLGADRTRRDREGRTAVDRAVAAGRWPVVARLDPGYPLPSAIAEAELLPELEAEGKDRAGLITTALRHGRVDVAATLFQLPPPLPESDRVAITTRLGDAPGHALDWWLARVADADFHAVHGARLLAEALAAEPPAPGLVAALSRAGAPVTGPALPARLLGFAGAVAEGEPALDLEALALDWIERGTDAFGAGPEGASPLHLAVRHGFERLVVALLARGADPNAADAHGATPLAEALALPAARAEAIARHLLAAGADPERAACDGRTPLGLALAQGRHALARWLDWPGPWRLPGRRPIAADLVEAAALGDVRAVERLVALGLPLDARDAKGATALIRAAGRGHPAVVAWLLEAGADPGLAASSGVDALTAAIAAHRDPVVRVLLDHGVAADAPVAHGVPPLLVAAAVGAAPCVGLLLERGARADATDPRGNTALHAAAQFAFTAADGDTALALLRRLVEGGCPVDAPNRDGQTALLLVLGSHAQPRSAQPATGLGRIAEWLASIGADVARQDARGVGVLHACAIHGLTDAALAMKRAGAPIEARDRLNRTPADLALMLGYADLAAELRPTRRPAG